MWLFKWLWKKFTGAPFEGGAGISLDEEEWKEKK
jgi:hypothetical protein